ncbi:MAG: nitroreductase family protein, partial [Phycisphaerales bacterium]
HKYVARRRTCRAFSDRPVPREIIEACVAAANTAPSGANSQPWHFVAIDDMDVKREIRTVAEKEDELNYGGRMPAGWRATMKYVGAGPGKLFLESAPWLMAVFRLNWQAVNGQRLKTFFPIESVGLACGFFLVACHMAGLATMVHAPNPNRLLGRILNRPSNEVPFLLIPVGYPAEDCQVPHLAKKAVDQVLTWNRRSRPLPQQRIKEPVHLPAQP